MKLIVISAPESVNKEAEIISLLIENGLEYYHLRKPEWDLKTTSYFLKTVSSDTYSHIVIHDHYELIEEFGLLGSHHNKRNSENIYGNNFSVSCHSIEEIPEWRNITKGYIFLSPIFQSISKEGYGNGFSENDLRYASANKIIDKSVIALGGITKENIGLVKEYGFGGCAVLGTIWEDYIKDNNIESLIERFKEIKNSID